MLSGCDVTPPSCGYKIGAEFAATRKAANEKEVGLDPRVALPAMNVLANVCIEGGAQHSAFPKSASSACEPKFARIAGIGPCAAEILRSLAARADPELSVLLGISTIMY